jgi:hypothetical protein
MLARCRAEYCSLLVASGLDLEQETQLHTHTHQRCQPAVISAKQLKTEHKKVFHLPELYHPLQRVDLVLHSRVHQGCVTRHLADSEFYHTAMKDT